MQKYIIIILIITFIACNSEHEKNTSYENETTEKVYTNYQKDSISKMKYMTDLYLSLKEPILSDLEYECYRLTLHKSFKNSMIFRLDRKGDDYHKLVVKEYKTDSKDGDPNKALLINEKTFDLTISEFKEFKNLINQSYYWTLKFWDEQTGFDGNTYVLEALLPWTRNNNKKKYHCVVRWEPYEGSFKQACEYLVEHYNKALLKK